MSRGSKSNLHPRVARFTDRVVLISGAAQGIGRSTAELFAGEGAKLLLCDRNVDALTRTCAHISELGGDATSFPIDVTLANEVEELFSLISREVGRLDVLINNAGGNDRRSIEDCDEEAFGHMLDLNATSTYSMSRRAAAIMRSQKSGTIVNLASVLSFVARAQIPAYIAAKGAITSLTRALAVELAPWNIRVNAVAPGYIATEPLRSLRDNVQFNDQLIKRTPAGRWGDPHEIAHCIAFLASDAASFVQGQVLIADGGLSISI